MSLRRISKLAVVAAVAFGLSPTAQAAAAQDVAVRLTDVATPLVPIRKTRGDREFGGGPWVDCSVYIYVSRDRRHLKAKVHFKAEETKGDRSTVDEYFYRTVYTAPSGKHIDRVLDSPSSTVGFRSSSAGIQFLVPGEDWSKAFDFFIKVANAITMMDKGIRGASLGPHKVREAAAAARKGNGYIPFQGNKIELRHPTRGPVSLIGIVGDTGGDDISDDRNPKDDTRIQSIAFKPGFRIRLK